MTGEWGNMDQSGAGVEPGEQTVDIDGGDDQRTMIVGSRPARTAPVQDEDQRTVLMSAGANRIPPGPPIVDGEVEDDQRTVLITGRPPRPAAPKPAPAPAAVEDDDQRTVLITARPPTPVAEDDDQRTVMVTPDMLKPPAPHRPPAAAPGMGAQAPSPQHWGAPPAPHQPPAPPQHSQQQFRPAPQRQQPAPQQAAPVWAPPPPQPRPASQLPLAEGYPEELTTSLTGSLLGAKAAPPRQVPKTSYRMVVPILIIGLLAVIVVGAARGHARERRRAGPLRQHHQQRLTRRDGGPFGARHFSPLARPPRLWATFSRL